MNSIVINATANRGCFTDPRFNNTNTTFKMMPKSTLIGILLGVIGVSRKEVKEKNLYAFLSNHIFYNITQKKESISKYTSRYGYNHATKYTQAASRESYVPTKFEFLENIDYDITILYDNTIPEVNSIMENFIRNVKNGVNVFPIYMGQVNYFASLEFRGEFSNIDSTPKTGVFETDGFVSDLDCSNIDDSTIMNLTYSDLPTKILGFLVHDFNSYKSFYFHKTGEKIRGVGNYYTINGKNYELI